MKAHVIAIMAMSVSSSAAFAQDAAPPMVDHSVVHTQTVTHNDGHKHRQITHVHHRTIVKTPQGTMVRTTDRTTNTAPR